MASQTQYLQKHGNQWRVRVKVPTQLVPIIGRTKLIHPLHTDSLKEANERKWTVVAAFKAQIAEAQKALATRDPLTAEALQHRLHILHGSTPPVPLEQRHVERFGPTDTDRDVTDEELSFLEVATSASTPLDYHLDAFADHKAYALKSRGDLKRAVQLLTDWLKTQHHPTNVEDIDRKLAGRFIDKALSSGRGSKKASAYLGFLREYWTWLIDQHDLAEESPWEGKRVAKEPRRRREAEPDHGPRPYTDDELAKLIYGPALAYLPDLMRIAALSGMRIEEICQLRVRDCAGGMLSVHYGKTDNSRRSVPIHPDLKATIEARCKDKAATDYLFRELPPVPKSREGRSDPASKRFTRYRRDMGVDERPNDKARSNIDFHSFRRWFARKAHDAWAAGGVGFTPYTIADIIGHDDEGGKRPLQLTMRDYPGPAPDAAKRACVEAVKLPPRPAPEGITPCI